MTRSLEVTSDGAEVAVAEVGVGAGKDVKARDGCCRGHCYRWTWTVMAVGVHCVSSDVIGMHTRGRCVNARRPCGVLAAWSWWRVGNRELVSLEGGRIGRVRSLRWGARWLSGVDVVAASAGIVKRELGWVLRRPVGSLWRRWCSGIGAVTELAGSQWRCSDTDEVAHDDEGGVGGRR